jgi:hypothetical protein
MNFMNYRAGQLLTIAMLVPCQLQASNWADRILLSTDIESEVSFETDSGNVQKSDFVLTPELNIDLSSNMRLTSIARVRVDLADRLVTQEPDEQVPNSIYIGDSIDIELREFYIDSYLGDSSLRVGKQQIVWGQADGLRVLDVVNPLDFREFILPEFEQRRIPLWTVNLEAPVGNDWYMQLVWIPDQTYDVMPEAGASYSFTSGKVIPTVPDGVPVTVRSVDKPNSFIKDSDMGIRLTAFLGGWDLSLNYLYHYHDQAVAYRQIEQAGVVVTPGYERTHLIGGSFSNAFGDLTLRGEVGYSTDRYFITNDPRDVDGVFETGELSYVIGLDYTLDADFLVSGQLFQSILVDDAQGAARERVENQLSLLIKKEFFNDTLTFETLLIHSINDSDGLVQAELDYQLTSNVELSVGFDSFYGTSNGIFGQFSDRDRFTLGVHIGL